MSAQAMAKLYIGLVILMTVIGAGFLQIDQATWEAWKYGWVVFAAGGISVGIILIIGAFLK